MSSNPKAFAQRVLDAFEAAGHATDEEVGDAGGPSTTTLAKYRKVAAGEMSMAEPRGDVLKRIDRAADWRGGSARALWREGREPIPANSQGLREALGLESRPTPGRVVRVGGMEGYVEWVAERLTEVEERLDLLTETVRKLGGGEGNDSSATTTEPLSAVDDSVDHLIAADQQETSISGEQEESDTP